VSGSSSIVYRRATVGEILDLRLRVLRAGLPAETAHFDGDEDPSTCHFAAFADGVCIACVSFMLNQWEGRPAWQLRGMAVDPGCQRRGVGRSLLEHSLRQIARVSDVRLMWCNARVPAVGFYQKHGWSAVSDEFDIPTAGPHRKMVFTIDASDGAAPRPDGSAGSGPPTASSQPVSACFTQATRTPFSRVLGRALFGLNHASLWRVPLRVWGRRMVAPSADRLLALWLHRLRLMGRDDRNLVEQLVRPGMFVADVGANVGLFTLLLSRLVGDAGRVHAFEPEPSLHAALAENCRRNAAANVTVHPLALGSKRDVLTLRRSALNSGDNRLDSDPGWGTCVAVPVDRMDAVLGATALDFVKIDVQGHEMQVLAGMEGILAASPRLMIHLEYWPAGLRRAGVDPPAVLHLLRDRGFSLYGRRASTWTVLDDADALTAALPAWRYVNVLAARQPVSLR